MPAGPIDRAFVQIEPVFDQFTDELDRGINDALNDVNADVDAATQQIGDSFDEAAIRASASVGEAADDIDASFQRTTASADAAANDWVVNITDAGATIRQQVKQTSDDVDQSFKQSTDNARANFQQLALDSNNQILLIDRTSQNLDASLGRLGRGVILTQVLTGAAGAAGALGTAILPVTGALAAIGPTMVVAGTAALGAKLAFEGVGDAISAIIEGDPGKIAEAMEDLPPPAREFAQIVAGLNPQFQELRATAADAVFSSLNTTIRPLAENTLPLLSYAIQETASELAALSFGASEIIGSDIFQAGFRTIIDSTSESIEKYGQAFLYLLEAFVTVSAAAGPLALAIATGVSNIADNLRDMSREAAASGQLTEFFQTAQERGTQLINIVSSLGQILVNVFRNAGDFGGGLLDTIERLLQSLEELTASAEGQQAIADFFQQLEEIIPRVGVLLQNVGRILFTLSETGGLESILEIFITLSGALATVLENNPGLATMVAQFAVWAAILNALKIGQFVSGMVGLVNIVRAGANTVSLFSQGLRGIQGASGAAATAGRLVATAFGVIRTAALSLFTTLGPAGLIAVGVIALVALIIANWDTVRGWLITAWNFIREAAVTAWQAIYDAVIQPVIAFVTDVIAFVTNLWNLWVQYNTLILQTAMVIWNMIVNAVITAINNIWTFIQPAVTLIVTFITTLWQNLVTVTTTVFTAIWTFMQTVWTAISTVVMTILTAVVTFIVDNFTAVWTFIQTIWNAVWTFFTTIWNAIYQVFLTVIGLIIGLIIGEFDFREFIMGMWNAISQFFITIWNAIFTLFQTTTLAIFTLIQTWLTNAQTFITTVWQAIQTFFGTVWTAIQEIFTTVLTAITTFLQEQWTAVSEFTQTVWDNILTFLQNTWDTALETAQQWGENIIDFFTDLWNDLVDFVTDFIADFLDTLQEGWDDAVDAAIDFVNDMIDAIQDFVGDMIDVGTDLVMGLVEGVQNAAGALVDAAIGVVQDALAAARAAIGADSPAREFITLGEASGEGLVVGLDRMRRNVRDAARSLAGTEIGGFASGVGGGGRGDLLGDEASRLAGSGVNIQNLNVQPISGRFNINEIIEELALQQKTLYANTVT